MSVGKLIEFFSTFTRLPVYAEDVRDQIVELGIQDEIFLEPMNAPAGRLMGMFVRYRDVHPPYQTCANKAVVFYNENTTPEEQNFICCKELMHVFDEKIIKVDNKDEFSLLVNYLFKGSVGASKPTISGTLDHVALFIALAVMFPHEIRDDFISAHADGRMTEHDISNELGIPSFFVNQLLQPDWEGFRSMLLKL